MAPPSVRSPATVMLLVGFGLFVATLIAIVVASLARREQPTFAPTAFPRSVARAGAADTITIDARDGDRWRYVSLTRGELLAPSDTAGWELAVRRYRLATWARAYDGGNASQPVAAQKQAPQWVETTRSRDTVNAALKSWYRYSMVTHLLESRGHRYGVETRDGRTIMIEILSYYCPGLVAGCLTIRSTLPR